MFGLEKYRDALGRPGEGVHRARAGLGSVRDFAGLLVCGLAFAWLGGYGIVAFVFAVIVLSIVTCVAGSIAVFDTVGTIVISAGIAKVLGVPFGWTFTALLISAEFMHVLFGVHAIA